MLSSGQKCRQTLVPGTWNSHSSLVQRPNWRADSSSQRRMHSIVSRVFPGCVTSRILRVSSDWGGAAPLSSSRLPLSGGCDRGDTSLTWLHRGQVASRSALLEIGAHEIQLRQPRTRRVALCAGLLCFSFYRKAFMLPLGFVPVP